MSRLDDRLNREGERFERSPFLSLFKWAAILVAVLLVIGAIFGVGSFVSRWVGTGAEIVGPTNVKEQHRLVIGEWEALQQEAANACAARTAPQNAQSPSFLEDPAFAYAAKYRDTRAGYNRRMNNLFEAGIVAPSGYPKIAPTLEEMQRRVC